MRLGHSHCHRGAAWKMAARKLPKRERNSMKMFSILGAAVLASLSAQAYAQDHAPLRLVQTIPMPSVKGRIDHMDVDAKGKRLFVAGLENGSVEVIDLRLANG